MEAWLPTEAAQQGCLDDTGRLVWCVCNTCFYCLLKDGEQEVILLFHDESAYHANDYQRDYWLKAGEQVLKKKEKGRR